MPGCLILYLPAYSPDLNPIEESFSAREYMQPRPDSQSLCHPLAVKAYLRRRGPILRTHPDPELAIIEACGAISPESCEAWFKHAGYIH